MSKTNPYRPQLFVIGADIFKVDVGVAVNLKQHEVMRRIRKLCSDEKQLAELKDEIDGWDDRTNGEGRMCKMGGGFFVLLCATDLSMPKLVSLVTHEMVHVTQYLLRDRRIPLDETTEEVHAYLTEHLVEQAVERIYQ